MNFTNTLNKDTVIISDYEGEEIKISEKENLIICGDILDSTIGGGGDESKIKEGYVGDINKTFNLKNIYQIVTNENIQLLLGNRDINKLKCNLLCKINPSNSNDTNNFNLVNNFNKGAIPLTKTFYDNTKELLTQNGWKTNMNNWLPFWNQTVFNNTHSNYNVWHQPTTTTTNTFLDRFNKIFGRDGAVGTMSAQNLLYTLPLELISDIQQECKKENINDKNPDDYLAFVVLAVFNSLFNNVTEYSGSEKYKKIECTTNLSETYVNGLLYTFFTKNVGKNINFIGYYKKTNKSILKKEEPELYLFSHGGITADLLKLENLEELKGIIQRNKHTITNNPNKPNESQAGGNPPNYTSKDIIERITNINTQMCNLVQDCLKSFYPSDEIPSDEMLLLLALSAPYKPDNNDIFIKQSMINPGVVEMIKEQNRIICHDAKLIQIFGHVPKGFGPSIFSFDNTHIVNIDISQSFKYGGKAGESSVCIKYTQKKFHLDYTLDTRFVNDLKNITFQPQDKGGDKIYEFNQTKYHINQPLETLFLKEQELKKELKSKIPLNSVIFYHGFDDEKNVHIFTLSDSYASYNKILIIYNTNTDKSKTGGYYEKYIKYKNKYIELKKNYKN